MGSLTAGAVAVTASPLLAACTTSGTANGKATKRTLKIAIDATPSVFDPATAGGPTTALVYQHVYEGLTRWKRVSSAGEKGGFDIDWVGTSAGTEFRMAKSVNVSPDNTRYTYELRQGWKSHYGNEFTSADVKWTFDRAMKLKGIGSFLNGLTHIKAVNAVSKYVVQFVLSSPSPSFPVDLNDYNYRGIFDSVESKKHATSTDPWAAKWLSTHEAGFGPYKLTSLVNGQQMTLSAVPKHPFPAKVSTLLFTVVPEASSRLALLSSGAVDVAVVLQPTDLQKLARTSNVRVWNFSSNNVVALPLNVNKAPLNDVRVRQALAYAVPYDELISGVYRGYGKPSYGPLPTHSPGLVDKSLFPYKLDIAKSKALMAAAGHGNGFTLTYIYEAEDRVGAQIGTQLRTSWSRIGVNLNLVAQPQSAYNANLYAGKFDVIFTSLGGDLPNPQYTLPLFYGKGGAANFNHYDSAPVNQLISQGAAIAEATKQFDFYRKDLAKAIIDDSPWLWLLEPGYQVATRNNVTGMNWYDGSADFSLVSFVK